MKRWVASTITVTTLLGIGLTIFPAVAEDDNQLSVPVAFGRGLNTNQQGNRVNHVVIPNQINTRLDGVVHFLVAGFHQVVVYRPGTQPEDIDVPATGTFIDDATNRYYLGINPGGGPNSTPGTIVPFSNSQNRVESVSFPALTGTGTPPSEQAQKGTYLVICNVRQHFLDGMFAFVKVH
jgi:hypothetical protein